MVDIKFSSPAQGVVILLDFNRASHFAVSTLELYGIVVVNCGRFNSTPLLSSKSEDAHDGGESTLTGYIFWFFMSEDR